MAKTNVGAQTQSIKILDRVLGDITNAQSEALEAQGLCLWLQRDGSALVIPVRAYEAICDLMGGVE